MGRHAGHDKPHGTKGANPERNGLEGPKIKTEKHAHRTGKRKKTPLFGKLSGGQPQFTKEKQIAFLKEYRRTGQLTTSALVAGTTRQTVENYRKNDPNFSQAFETAYEMYVDEIRQEAHRRAVHGTLEPVIGGKDKDVVVARIRRFSDTLMMAHLKKHDPGFKEKIEVESKNTNVNANVDANFDQLKALDPAALEHVEKLLGALGSSVKQESKKAEIKVLEDTPDDPPLFTDEEIAAALLPEKDVRKPDYFESTGDEDGNLLGSDGKMYDKDGNA